MKTKITWLFVRTVIVTGIMAMALFAALRQQKEDTEPKKPTFRAVSVVGCRKASWEPEVFSFYGDPAAVRAKLENFEMHLPDRRVFMFIVESSQSAELSLFELEKDDKDGKGSEGGDKFHVWTWKGKSASELRENATDTILANKGVLCVGEQVKGLVKSLKPEDRGVVPAPKTALAAFGHAIKGYDDQYIRLTVFLLC
jgi:hypothetical protein